MNRKIVSLFYLPFTFTSAVIGLIMNTPVSGYAENEISKLEKLANLDPKPFVVVEASGKDVKSRGQGVVISEEGHVLSAAHITWIDSEGNYSDDLRISFRGNEGNIPKGKVHLHTTKFSDREGAIFKEIYFGARLVRTRGSRFLEQMDVGLFKIDSKGVKSFPKIDFFSEKKPRIQIGEVFHLCHYNFPHKPGDPFFLINPVEVVGVAQTSSGLQYLAKGYYRIGSSGSAILKDGKLIGIQSSAYTVNAKDIGEIPLGLISFHMVWRNQIKHLLEE